MITGWRIAKWAAVTLVALFVIYAFYITFEVWHGSTLDQRPKVDAIVVLGAAQYNGNPSPVLKARLDHAAELYKMHLAPRVVVTGGKIPGDTHTEAGASAAYLASKGVPDEVILREVDGRTSWQSLQAAARFMKTKDIHSVILVSDSFHDARITAMSKSLGLQSYVSPDTNSPIRGSSRIPYFFKEVIDLGGAKIFGFSRFASLESSFASN